MDKLIIGLDECGWGCIAGPLTAAACYIPEDLSIIEQLQMMGFRDSKQMDRAEREELVDSLKHFPDVLCEVYHIPAHEWDEIGALAAWHKCLRMASKLLLNKLNFWEAGQIQLIVDGNREIVGLPGEWDQCAIPRADQSDLRCSVASVVAKVTRDRMMVDLATRYPFYGFDTNVGYPTREHLAALMAAGPVFAPEYIHRKRSMQRKMVYTFLEKHWKKATPKWVTDPDNWLNLKKPASVQGVESRVIYVRPNS